MQSAQSSRPTWVFYYDGDCSFCGRSIEWLSRFDFLGQVTWARYQSLEQPPSGLAWDDLDRSAYLEAGERMYEGFYAFRMLTLRMWALAVLAPVMWLPGLDLIGALAYRWVARNRCRLSACGSVLRGC